MNAQLALPFEEGRDTCTIYLNLTREDVERLREGINLVDGLSSYHYYMEYNTTKKFIVPLLWKILVEAKKETP